MDLAASQTTRGSAAGRKPFATYPGGKDAAGAAERIIRVFPPHSVYVEAFIGGGAVFRRKTPALRNIGIDADADVIGRWRRCRVPGLEVIQADAVEWLASEAPRLPGDALIYAVGAADAAGTIVRRHF